MAKLPLLQKERDEGSLKNLSPPLDRQEGINCPLNPRRIDGYGVPVNRNLKLKYLSHDPSILQIWRLVDNDTTLAIVSQIVAPLLLPCPRLANFPNTERQQLLKERNWGDCTKASSLSHLTCVEFVGPEVHPDPANPT